MAAVRGLGALPPQVALRDGNEIASRTGLSYYGYWQVPRLLDPWIAVQKALLGRTPDLTLLCTFHRDGRLREIALKHLDAAPTPFWFAAIAQRLNDWAPQVRDAAVHCARRVFPHTDPHVIAGAATALVMRTAHWKRWAPDQAAVLDEAFARPDVVQALVTLLKTARRGPMGTVLRQLLTLPRIDTQLPILALEAEMPSVRTMAMRTLIEGRAVWPVGRERVWVDKSMSRFRMALRTAERPVQRSGSLEELIGMASRDKSAAVRKIAADALIRGRHELADVRSLAARLAGDRNGGVADRIDFLTRTLAKEAEGA